MYTTKEDTGKGAVNAEAGEMELDRAKGKNTGSVPNASKDQMRRTKEERLRELLALEEGVKPSLAEIRCAEDVIVAETELAGAGVKTKYLAEENLEVAHVCLVEELQKRTGSEVVEVSEEVKVIPSSSPKLVG